MQTTVAHLAEARLLLDCGALGPEWHPFLCALATTESTSDDPAPGLPHAMPDAADGLAITQQRTIDARSSEPGWNRVHYAWGYLLGTLGLPPRNAFNLLDMWERFEHDSLVGRKLALSMDEGAYGYLWDLEHGMAGYSAAARYFRGEGPRAQSAIPESRRGGYGD